LELKGIKSYLDDFSEVQLKNRVLFGEVRLTEANKIDEEIAEKEEKNKVEEIVDELAPIFQIGKDIFLPKNMLFWERYYCIMITSKPFVRPKNSKQKIPL
jgi:hypothetical protein